MEQRESGWYWVRENDNTWAVARWEDDLWLYDTIEVQDDAFAEIGRRIPSAEELKALKDKLAFETVPLSVPEALIEYLKEIRERIAALMIAHGFATGHGDKSEDLLKKLDGQLTERRAQVKALEADRARLRKAISSVLGGLGPTSAVWGNSPYDRAYCNGVTSALTAFDDECKRIDAAIRADSQTKEPG